MFNINDKVIHAREGLSTIIGVRTFNDQEYFVITPDNNSEDNIYVLKNNTGSNIRHLMDLKTANEIVEYMKSVGPEFISNTKQRREQYRKRLTSGDVKELAYLSKQLYLFETLNANGVVVKLGPNDLQMLVDAEKILYDELAIVLGVSREAIKEYLAALIA